LKDILKFKRIIDQELEQLSFPLEPSNLYDPLRYILASESKRMRSIALLLSHQLYNKDFQPAITAALSIELFHNFTLIHDDIMDKALLRRGSQTVHEKWDNNIAILSGDTLLVNSYSLISSLDKVIMSDVLDVFSETAILVCEGQQLDMDFEQQEDVTIQNYLEMIEKKTSVLLAASFQIGALIGGAVKLDQKLLYDFGINLGMAFQLQDDLLDLYGDSNKFGKKMGGDIIANKKTYLYLKSLSLADFKQKEELVNLYSKSIISEEEKVARVRIVFDQLDIFDITKNEIENYHAEAIACLNTLSINKKDDLNHFADILLKREV
jgi:geranylgeranyl diphosphate synthase type II